MPVPFNPSSPDQSAIIADWANTDIGSAYEKARRDFECDCSIACAVCGAKWFTGEQGDNLSAFDPDIREREGVFVCAEICAGEWNYDAQFEADGERLRA